MTVVATAGHVDHGKSTLVEALTGTDPDRWAEEKERGLTIDLGFAVCHLDSGEDLSLVDVPGHIRFLRNMLAGVGAVQGCLFVVSAVEGWKPQSEEHLRILDLLGIDKGVVVVTKADLVDDELMELAAMEITDHVADTFLEGTPIVGVSALTGAGMDELRRELDALVASIGPAPDIGRPRLWVDRSFAPAGAGTVVTGTLVDGSLSVGDEVVITPSMSTARVRGLQRHHRPVERADPGTRLAVNLTGVSHREIGRGNTLIQANQWYTSTMVDAELRVLSDLDHQVSRRGAYSVYLGSGEFSAKVRILGAEKLSPGETGQIRIHLPRPVPVLPGDRFILRESGRDSTIGGGSIIDVDPQTSAASARPTTDLELIVAARGWVTVDRLRLVTGREVEPVLDRWVVSPEALATTKSRVRDLVDAAGPLGLDIASLDDMERATLGLFDDIAVDAGRAAMGEAPDPLADHPWVAALEAEPFSPPGPEGVDRDEVRQLVRRGLVIESDGRYFGAKAVEQAAQLISNAIEASTEGVSVAEVRDLLSTSRKFVLPLLGYFDTNGMTRRRGDLRVSGPRLPDPVAPSS